MEGSRSNTKTAMVFNPMSTSAATKGIRPGRRCVSGSVRPAISRAIAAIHHGGSSVQPKRCGRSA
jgi:hypothetical protein